ncbi:hypothetical protein U1Q18_030506 [Sarracenia purpurea var. burkii]
MKKLVQQAIDDGEDDLKKRREFWRIMERPEISLAPAQCAVVEKGSGLQSPESESSLCRKRKSHPDHLFNFKTERLTQTSVDLQLNDPLPLDWERCLDLQSGRMYYLNRKSLRKTWDWPKEQKLDLELNISSCSQQCSGPQQLGVEMVEQSSSSSNNMVALACLNCHLLVILSKSSPSCPNCKYFHSLPTHQSHLLPPPPPNVRTSAKSLSTLSLLN